MLNFSLSLGGVARLDRIDGRSQNAGIVWGKKYPKKYEKSAKSAPVLLPHL
jgi:hypothetical protein